MQEAAAALAAIAVPIVTPLHFDAAFLGVLAQALGHQAAAIASLAVRASHEVTWHGPVICACGAWNWPLRGADSEGSRCGASASAESAPPPPPLTGSRSAPAGKFERGGHCGGRLRAPEHAAACQWTSSDGPRVEAVALASDAAEVGNRAVHAFARASSLPLAPTRPDAATSATPDVACSRAMSVGPVWRSRCSSRRWSSLCARVAPVAVRNAFALLSRDDDDAFDAGTLPARHAAGGVVAAAGAVGVGACASIAVCAPADEVGNRAVQAPVRGVLLTAAPAAEVREDTVPPNAASGNHSGSGNHGPAVLSAAGGGVGVGRPGRGRGHTPTGGTRAAGRRPLGTTCRGSAPAARPDATPCTIAAAHAVTCNAAIDGRGDGRIPNGIGSAPRAVVSGRFGTPSVPHRAPGRGIGASVLPAGPDAGQGAPYRAVPAFFSPCLRQLSAAQGCLSAAGDAAEGHSRPGLAAVRPASCCRRWR